MKYTGWNITAFDDKGEEHVITDVPKFVAEAVDDYLFQLEEAWLDDRYRDLEERIAYFKEAQEVAGLSKADLMEWNALEDEYRRLEGEA